MNCGADGEPPDAHDVAALLLLPLVVNVVTFARAS
jgi:hypothetical protein